MQPLTRVHLMRLLLTYCQTSDLVPMKMKSRAIIVILSLILASIMVKEANCSMMCFSKGKIKIRKLCSNHGWLIQIAPLRCPHYARRLIISKMPTNLNRILWHSHISMQTLKDFTNSWGWWATLSRVNSTCLESYPSLFRQFFHLFPTSSRNLLRILLLELIKCQFQTNNVT